MVKVSLFSGKAFHGKKVCVFKEETATFIENLLSFYLSLYEDEVH